MRLYSSPTSRIRPTSTSRPLPHMAPDCATRRAGHGRKGEYDCYKVDRDQLPSDPVRCFTQSKLPPKEGPLRVINGPSPLDSFTTPQGVIPSGHRNHPYSLPHARGTKRRLTAQWAMHCPSFCAAKRPPTNTLRVYNMIDIALIDLGTIQQLRSGFEWSRQRRAMASQHLHLSLYLTGRSLGERRSSIRVAQCLLPTAAHRMHFDSLHTQEEKVKVSRLDYPILAKHTNKGTRDP